MDDILDIGYKPKNVLLIKDEAIYDLKITGFGAQKPLCLSFELYPEQNAVHKVRQLAYFAGIITVPKEGLSITVHFKYPDAYFMINGEKVEPSNKWAGDFKEDGMYDMYFTLAEDVDGSPRELVRKKVKQFVIFDPRGQANEDGGRARKELLLKKWGAHDRRYPVSARQDQLTLKHIADVLRQTLAGYEKRDINLLDVGCNEKPYYPFFDDIVKNYVGADICHTPYNDLICVAEKMPFGDETFDFLICSQVLEHVMNPFKCASEMMRVTKKGGTIFITAPFVWDIHDFPGDYWRFSPDGLKLLFKGVSEKEIFLNGNSVQALTEKLNGVVYRSIRSEFIKEMTFRLTNFFIKRAGFFKDDLLPSNCILVAVK